MTSAGRKIAKSSAPAMRAAGRFARPDAEGPDEQRGQPKEMHDEDPEWHEDA
jgi:hypothetical protein